MTEQSQKNYADEEIRAELVDLRGAEVQERHKSWLAERPEVVRKMAESYPFDRVYRVKDDAPYGLTAPGAIVGVRSYFEDGSVAVVVLKDPPGQFTYKGARYQLDPQWLDPVPEFD